MLVKATKTGFIGGALRSAGDTFEILESSFSPNWMEKLQSKSPKKAAQTVEEMEKKAFNIPPEVRYDDQQGVAINQGA